MSPVGGERSTCARPPSSAGRWLAAILVAIPWSTSWAQEIYRCERDGQVVFSDLPCDDDAEVYRSGHRLSVIEPADGLDGVAEENRAFVAERRRRLAERRERAEQARADEEIARLRAAAARAAMRGDRLIIGPGRRVAERFPPQSDPRDAQRRREADDDRRVDRRTLLSRSGSDRPILPREPPGYQ